MCDGYTVQCDGCGAHDHKCGTDDEGQASITARIHGYETVYETRGVPSDPDVLRCKSWKSFR